SSTGLVVKLRIFYPYKLKTSFRNFPFIDKLSMEASSSGGTGWPLQGHSIWNSLTGEPTAEQAAASGGGSSALGGYVAVLTAGLFFGSNFVPARKYPTGNGIFFQWLMCSGIFITGLSLYCLLGFPSVPRPHYAMLGGAFWCGGNLMAVPIIQRIGMALGLCVWNVCNMLIGWTSGFLGILGATKADVAIPWLNVTGAFMACCACACYMGIKPTMSKGEAKKQQEREQQVAMEMHSLALEPRVSIEQNGGPRTSGTLGQLGFAEVRPAGQRTTLASPLIPDQIFNPLAPTISVVPADSKSASSGNLQKLHAKSSPNAMQPGNLTSSTGASGVPLPKSSTTGPTINFAAGESQASGCSLHVVQNPTNTMTSQVDTGTLLEASENYKTGGASSSSGCTYSPPHKMISMGGRKLFSSADLHTRGGRFFPQSSPGLQNLLASYRGGPSAAGAAAGAHRLSGPTLGVKRRISGSPGLGAGKHLLCHPNTFASVQCCAPAMSYISGKDHLFVSNMNLAAAAAEMNVEDLLDPGDDTMETDDAAEAAKDRFVGFLLCLLSGVLYGVNFNPVFNVIDNYPGAPKNVLNYIFWHYCGIYVVSTIAMLIYCCVSKNRPSFVSPQTIFPGFLSGVVWGVGQICWFIANDSLGFCVAYPLVPSVAGLVACAWGALVFGEIQGTRNYRFLFGGFMFVCTAGACIGISS
ncbi:unnamed protein product, partial [Amoebophrya sp. A25]